MKKNESTKKDLLQSPEPIKETTSEVVSRTDPKWKSKTHGIISIVGRFIAYAGIIASSLLALGWLHQMSHEYNWMKVNDHIPTAEIQDGGELDSIQVRDSIKID